MRLINTIFLTVCVVFFSHANTGTQIIDWKMLNAKARMESEHYPELTNQQRALLQYYFNIKDNLTFVDRGTHKRIKLLFDNEKATLDDVIRIREKNLKSMSALTNEFDGKYIRIAGFVVPVEFNSDMKAVRMLLVPIAGACVHVPAPPANQIIDVKYPQGYVVEGLDIPVWLEGHFYSNLNNEELNLMDGEVEVLIGYEVIGSKIEKYLHPY
ncbi:DUF3299 domain-containing protein [Vibrio owensii]|uniref:DUF3299 domain-containing protein n=1 Tax=Vibrio owensii TaxID=696485 RepID=UPI004067B33E